MNNRIVIPPRIARALRRHLFQNQLEQGAFLFAQSVPHGEGVSLAACDYYLVPSRGWEVQMDVYLQMKDSERGKIMKLAREKELCAIDCHSHPHADKDVWFSPSDIAGITDFAEYVKWKLDAKPFAAIVWGRESVDAVVWRGDFARAERVATGTLLGNRDETFVPTGSWFRTTRATKSDQYE